MHWIIQNNIFHEWGMENLLAVLLKERYTFSVHRVVPFVGELIPDISPEGPVMVIGSTALRHAAKRKGWKPGVFDLDHITHQMQVDNWGHHFLNYEATICQFKDVEAPEGDFFIRPEGDNKQFAGTVTNKKDFGEWRQNVMRYVEDELIFDRPIDDRKILADSNVVINKLINIKKEYRFWIVNGEIATHSQYKFGNNVIYANEVEPEVIEYVEFRVKQWNPADAFVMDIALTDDGYKILEINTLNSSGFYAADVEKLVYAIGNM